MTEILDREIRDGFPAEWFVQDRLGSYTALLVRETPGMWPGTRCVCVRPSAISTEEWLPLARAIAEAVNSHASLTAERDRLREALTEAERVIDLMADVVTYDATMQGPKVMGINGSAARRAAEAARKYLIDRSAKP